MLVTCQKCGLKDTDRKEMEFDLVGVTKKSRKYYHKGDCWDTYLKEKAFKEEEQAKKDQLNEVLLEIYGVKQVPKDAWAILEDFRCGVPIFKGRQVSRRYKEGYDYLLIKETFSFCSETIEYANRTKNFNGFMGAFMYAMAIIMDKIFVVEKRQKEREAKRIQMQRHIENIDHEDQTFESNYKKPSKRTDITEFLDD